MLRQSVHSDEAVDKPPHRPEVDIDLVDQGRLQTIDARVIRARHREAGILERLLEAGRGRGANRADQRLHAAHELGVLGVGGVILGQADPVEQQELGARLQYPVDLPEEGGRVLAQAEGLDLVEGVELGVPEGERQDVLVMLHELVAEPALLVELAGLRELVGVDVEPDDLRARVARHVRGHPAAAAAEIQNSHPRSQSDVPGDSLLGEQLVVPNGRLLVHEWGDVHLLHIAQTAQMVEYGIVSLQTVSHSLGVVRAESGNHLILVCPVEVVNLVRSHEIVYFFWRKIADALESSQKSL